MVVITSPAPPGVVIQLDGHNATRLAMTRMGSLAFPCKRLSLVCRPVMNVSVRHLLVVTLLSQTAFLSAAVIGTNSPSLPLTSARIG